MEWLHRVLMRFNFYRHIIGYTKVIILPGFKPLTVYSMFVFFANEFKQNKLSNKAASLAYSFMLAIFPATIFLCTLIPYIPITHFQDTLLNVLAQVMPDNIYSAFETTFTDIIKNQNGKLFSFGFLFTLFFATNGVSKLMQAFNKSSLIQETRSYIRRRWIALALTVVISFSLLVAIVILILGHRMLHLLQMLFHSNASGWHIVIDLLRWIVVVVIFFVTVSLLYRYGPAHKQKRWKFLSPGSILATFLAVLTSLGFTFYINNFASYNKIYGSIGTLIVVMLWLYLNSLIILIGFELNASIELSKLSIKIVKPRYNSFKSKTAVDK